MQNKTPLISVIIPVYKVEKYLERCVKSVISQSYKNLEIILVDDGSPDGCPEICDSLSKEDKRIRVIHKENGGLSSARNAGLDVINGEYVFFLDSDDEITEKCIELLYSVLINNDCDISIGRYISLDENGEETEKAEYRGEAVVFDTDSFWNSFYSHIKNYDYAYCSNMVISCNKLIKADIFSEIRFTEGKLNEDEYIIHYLTEKAQGIVFLDSPTYKYYRYMDTITRKKKVNTDAVFALSDRALFFKKLAKSYTFSAFIHFYSFSKSKYFEYKNISPEAARLVAEEFKKTEKEFRGAIFKMSPKEALKYIRFKMIIR